MAGLFLQRRGAALRGDGGLLSRDGFGIPGLKRRRHRAALVPERPGALLRKRRQAHERRGAARSVVQSWQSPGTVFPRRLSPGPQPPAVRRGTRWPLRDDPGNRSLGVTWCSVCRELVCRAAGQGESMNPGDLRDRLQASLGTAYTLERELGGGGMSRVWVATETALGRQVVVKVIAPELTEGLSAERFTREVRLAARLQQANVVPVLTAGDAAGLPYYTMPYVRGESLRARMASGTPPSVGERVSMLRDVARALAYAHEEGIVHRDIKPENVLLSHGTAMVADFGIAKAINAARGGIDRPEGDSPKDLPEATLTSVGSSLGTPAYMAPEQAVGDAVDHRTDLYAWGLLAYELLTGAHPFGRHTTPQTLIAAHLTEPPPPFTASAQVPPSLAALVLRCLEKDPAR